MTWQEVNDMKPGTRVKIIEMPSYLGKNGTVLTRLERPGWRFSYGNAVWSCDADNNSSFKPTPRGWRRNDCEYELIVPEGRNKL